MDLKSFTRFVLKFLFQECLSSPSTISWKPGNRYLEIIYETGDDKLIIKIANDMYNIINEKPPLYYSAGGLFEVEFKNSFKHVMDDITVKSLGNNDLY